jgi:hypothetical protein
MRKASVTVRPCRMGGSCRSGSAALGWRFQAAPSVVVVEERGGQNSELRHSLAPTPPAQPRAARARKSSRRLGGSSTSASPSGASGEGRSRLLVGAHPRRRARAGEKISRRPPVVQSFGLSYCASCPATSGCEGAEAERPVQDRGAAPPARRPRARRHPHSNVPRSPASELVAVRDLVIELKDY